MSLTAPRQESKFELVPAGNHVARVYRIIQLGTVPETFQGEEKQVSKIMIGFELPNETKVFKEEKGAEPFVVSREFTFSMNEKANMRKLVEGIIGTALDEEEAATFDIAKLIGLTCLLNVVHKKSEKTGNAYALIQGASPIPKGMSVPDAVNKPELLYYSEWNAEIYAKLPQFIQDKMKLSKEWQENAKLYTIPF
jgi:hypothetical protein